MQIALAQPQIDAITDACRRHQVLRMHAFGSVLHAGYKPGESDIDLLVEFQPLDPARLYKTYFALLNELRDRLDSQVDLVMADAVNNPFIRKTIDATKQQIYAA